MVFGTYTYLKKKHKVATAILIPRIVTHKHKDDRPPGGSVVQPWNLALRLN